MLYLNPLATSGSNDSKTMIPGQPKKFEDTELQALVDENPCQSQKQLTEILGVTRVAVSKRLHAWERY